MGSRLGECGESVYPSCTDQGSQGGGDFLIGGVQVRREKSLQIARPERQEPGGHDRDQVARGYRHDPYGSGYSNSRP